MESSAPDFEALSPNIAAVFGGVIPDITPIEALPVAPVEDVWAKFFTEHRGESRYPGVTRGGDDAANPFARPHPELPWVDRGLPASSAAGSATAASDVTIIGTTSWEAEVPPLPKAG